MTRLFFIILVIMWAGLGLGCLGVAAASFMKSHEPAVVRAGFYTDYMNVATIMSGVGVLFLVAAVIGLVVALSQKKPAVGG